MSNIDCGISTSANWNKIMDKKDKIVKNCNSLRLPWEEAVAPSQFGNHWFRVNITQILISEVKFKPNSCISLALRVNTVG